MRPSVSEYLSTVCQCVLIYGFGIEIIEVKEEKKGEVRGVSKFFND